jgi:hypothetical protein
VAVVVAAAAAVGVVVVVCVCVVAPVTRAGHDMPPTPVADVFTTRKKKL